MHPSLPSSEISTNNYCFFRLEFILNFMQLILSTNRWKQKFLFEKREKIPKSLRKIDRLVFAQVTQILRVFVTEVIFLKKTACFPT